MKNNSFWKLSIDFFGEKYVLKLKTMPKIMAI
jgi:hypothetical protein